jgi:acetyl esterase/lipase
VPIGFLGAVTLVAWCTLFALVPPRPRRSSPSNMSYWFGYLLNELPFAAFYWLLASTLLAIGQGDVDTPVGRVAFGLAVLTTVGLGVVAWRGLRARSAVDHAVTEGLGAGWRAAIAAQRRRLPRRRDVERVANISYGEAGSKNLLDVYRRRSHRSGGPVLIHLHGGAFRRGRKSREARPLLYRLASQGWVCISANYRLSPAATFHHLIDVKKVIAWARAHGPEYGADPAMVFVAGSSAGGHLATLAALTPNDPVFQPGFEGADTSVAAAISLYGYYGSLGSDDEPSRSPLAFVRRDAPPFFLAHGDKDTLVLVEDALHFVEQLRDASSSPVVYAELPGAQHTFDLFHSLRFVAVVDAIEAFASWVRTNVRQAAPDQR